MQADNHSKTTSFFSAILLAGFVAGSIDITLAVINFVLRTHKDPVLIFYFISSSILGKVVAYQGGGLIVALGFLLHYLVAYTFTFGFFLAYPKIKLLQQNKFFVAVIYGLVVWTIMSLVVVPLSRIGKFPSDVIESIKGAVILMIAIGLPVRWFAEKYYSKKV